MFTELSALCAVGAAGFKLAGMVTHEDEKRKQEMIDKSVEKYMSKKLDDKDEQ